MTLSLSRLSTEDVAAKVEITENGTIINPTSNTVQIAIRPNQTAPGASDWKDATWEVISGSYYAKISVGPGTSIGTLAPGLYEAWVRVNRSPLTLVGKAPARIVVY